MADYWGIGQIAKRMGITDRTLVHWHRARGFLMYPRRKRGVSHDVWYTNDALILAWEIDRSKQTNKTRLRRAPYSKTPRVLRAPSPRPPA